MPSMKSILSRLRRSTRDQPADKDLDKAVNRIVKNNPIPGEPASKKFGGTFLELDASVIPSRKPAGSPRLRCEFTMVDTETGRTWALHKTLPLNGALRDGAKRFYSHLPEYDAFVKHFLQFDRVFDIDGKFVLAEDYWNYRDPISGEIKPKIYGSYLDRTKPISIVWPDDSTAKPYQGKPFDLPYHEKFGGRFEYMGTITGRFTSDDKKKAQPHHMPAYCGLDLASGPDETVHIEMQMPGLNGEPLTVRRMSAAKFKKWMQQPISKEEADAIRKRYFSIYPAMEEWSKHMTEKQTERKYVPNPADATTFTAYGYSVNGVTGELSGVVEAAVESGKVLHRKTTIASKAEQEKMRASGILSDQDILINAFLTCWADAYQRQVTENNFKAELLAQRAAKRAPDLSDVIVVGGEDYFALLSFHCITGDQSIPNGNSYTFQLPGKMQQPSGAIRTDIVINITDEEFTKLGISNNLFERVVYARDRARTLWDMRRITSAFLRNLSVEVMGRGVVKIHDSLFVWYKSNGELGGACTGLDEALDRAGRGTEKYTIGEATMERVFKPTSLTDVSDMQAVFDQVEAALVTLLDRNKQVPKVEPTHAVSDSNFLDLDGFIFELVRDLAYAMDDSEERAEADGDGHMEPIHVVSDDHWEKLSGHLDKLDASPVIDPDHPDDLLGAAAKLAVLLKLSRLK